MAKAKKAPARAKKAAKAARKTAVNRGAKKKSARRAAKKQAVKKTAKKAAKATKKQPVKKTAKKAAKRTPKRSTQPIVLEGSDKESIAGYASPSLDTVGSSAGMLRGGADLVDEDEAAELAGDDDTPSW